MDGRQQSMSKIGFSLKTESLNHSMEKTYMIGAFGVLEEITIVSSRPEKDGLIPIVHDGVAKRLHPSRVSTGVAKEMITTSASSDLLNSYEIVLIKDGGQFNHSTTLKTICLINNSKYMKCNVYNDNIEKIKDKLEDQKSWKEGDLVKIQAKCLKDGYLKHEKLQTIPSITLSIASPLAEDLEIEEI